MITLNQAFYGRNPEKGYRMFASSAPQHNAIIERLCAAVGTPDGASTVEPFYINFIENGYRYMISCCMGDQDAGRDTLFFHAFIGKHDDLKKSGVGIGTLIQEKFFKNKYEPGPVLPVSVEDSSYTLPWGKTSIIWNNEKLAIGSEKPELSMLSGILKNNIDDMSWASFSFKPLNDFQLYIISKFVAFPQDRKCLSPTGDVLSLPQHKYPTNKTTYEKPRPPKNKGKIIFLLFLLSVLINCIFAGVLFSRSTSKITHSHDTPPQTVEKIVYKEVPVKGATTRETVIKELRSEFDRRYSRINGSWVKALESDRALSVQYHKYKKPQLYKAGEYIQFVHEFIFEDKEK